MTNDSLTPQLEQDEGARLNALRRFEILDTLPDGSFDDITAVAAVLLRVPIAIISLVDNDRIWFKSHHGLETAEVRREPGLCASAILSPAVYEVRDAAVDVRSLTNPLVTGALGLRFYAASPLRTRDGFNLGTLCVIDREPRELTASDTDMLTRLAALVMHQMELRLASRKLAELERAQHESSERLRETNRALKDSDEKFRDLFDEAPIAYVYEGLDSRFIRINRAARKILGIPPDGGEGLFGSSFVPDTPEAQGRLRDALQSMGRGTDTSGVVLELRRADNGKPVWVQWWSSPAPDGDYTRTMFVDITDRVLMEQERVRLLAENAYLSEELRRDYNFSAIVGESPGLRKVMQQTQLVALTDVPVLITGESGTGKELVARAIHEQSSRKGRVLIKVNCSAVPDSLFESEFFGHVRGAFTGAIKDKPGRFELADGGTLFLDEIGEVPLAMQAKLLRVLQEKEMQRVGDSRTVKVDVRIIAATNRDLKQEVEAGRFRQDLFYRVSVFPLEVPPLRQRREDIPPLATHFARQCAQKMNRPAPTISPAAMNDLANYDWPGNVRELQNAIERAVILAQGAPLRFELTQATPAARAPDRPPVPPTLLTREEVRGREKENIASALKETGGRVFGPNGAAALLGMRPTTLSSRIKALGIDRRR